MAISYNKLWKILIDKKMKKSELINKAGISSNVIARLGHEQSISLESLEKICIALGCEIGDIIEFTEVDKT